MRRHNGKRAVSAFNFGKNITSQTLLYQHMSNHYRRILNAKKAVDTAPPIAFKEKHNARSIASSSPVNNFVPKNKKSVNRNISPAPSERTISTTSNGGFYWGTESDYGNKLQNSKCNCTTTMKNFHNASGMELVDKITYDPKCGPTDCFINGYKDVKGRTRSSKFKNPYEGKMNGICNNSAGNTKKISVDKNKTTAQKRKLSQKDRFQLDIMEKHSKFFISFNDPFYPRILKTDVASKLRSLPVYYPPIKSMASRNTSNRKESQDSKEIPQILDAMKSESKGSNNKAKREGSSCKCGQALNAREASQTSSRDSAYNGGVSSLPESRSPTPDQRKVKNCCCAIKSIHSYFDSVEAENESLIIPNLRLTENQHSQTELLQTLNQQIVENNERHIINNCQEDVIQGNKFENTKSEKSLSGKNILNDDMERKLFISKIKEEAIYTNFIRDITAEVLEKGLFTDKAVKKVMKRHMLSNINQLDKGRMLKEVDKLRIQLGIPEDDELLDINLDLNTEITSFEKDNYSLISESELIDLIHPQVKEMKIKRSESSLATNIKSNKSENSKDFSHSDNLFPKSISQILDQSDDNNQIVLNSDTDDGDDDEEDEELISVIHVSKMLKKSDQSLSMLQGDSADESEQSSDHVVRRKKQHPSRHRKIDKISSSSEEMEHKNHGSDVGKYYTVNSDIWSDKNDSRGDSNRKSKSCSVDEQNATDAEVELDNLL